MGLHEGASFNCNIQLFVCYYLLISDVGADHLLVPPDGRDEVPPRPKFVTQKIPQIELFPFGYPITSTTEYFGGIDISISRRGQASGALLVLALPCRVVQVIVIL